MRRTAVIGVAIGAVICSLSTTARCAVYGDDKPIDDIVFMYLALALLSYFVPTIVAFSRGHLNTTAIFVMNIFLGWTFLGWVGALVWSFTSNTRERQARSSDLNWTWNDRPIRDRGFSFETIPTQVVGESDSDYAERLRRLREMQVLPPPRR